MGYRILADENVERATINYLHKLDHDIEWLGDVPELGLGADDEEIARYARETDRLISPRTTTSSPNWTSSGRQESSSSRTGRSRRAKSAISSTNYRSTSTSPRSSSNT
jgi:hypothetical protein